MNKISIRAVTLILSLLSLAAYPQVNNKQVTYTAEPNEDVFYHTIERGQTVYAIATMYGVSVDDIYNLNPESREVIKAGETLRVPQKQTATSETSPKGRRYIYHTIRPKETLYGLSIRYNVPATDIIRANPGLSTSTFTIGRTIRVPLTRVEPATERRNVEKVMEYTVQRKETLYRISQKFNVSTTRLLALNPELKNGTKAGMVIKIPVTEEETVTRSTKSLDEGEVNALLSTPRDIKRVRSIQVALLLPFTSDGASAQSSSTPRFVEYYEGLLLAIDSLRELNVSIELSVYDTGDGTKKLQSILKEEAMLNANLIIGGVRNEQIGLIADFAQAHDIKYVIPFTSRNDDVLSNANVYQVNTPHSYLYSKAAQAGCQLFADDHIIIVNIKDKEEKPDFIKTLKTELSQRDIPYMEWDFNEETFYADMDSFMVLDKRNVVIPTSASLDALNKIKAPLRMLSELQEEEYEPYDITLFGYPEWQTYTRECLEDFYALNTYIYTNFYADNLSAEVHKFYNDYKNWYSKILINTFPKYGILGFDTGMFFFGAINKYGSNFENSLDKIRYKSVQTGFDFHRVNNWGGFINTNVFIVHYQDDFTVTRSSVISANSVSEKR